MDRERGSPCPSGSRPGGPSRSGPGCWACRGRAGSRGRSSSPGPAPRRAGAAVHGTTARAARSAAAVPTRTPSAPLTLLAQTPWVTPGQHFVLQLEAGAGTPPPASSACRSPSTPACPASRDSTSRCSASAVRYPALLDQRAAAGQRTAGGCAAGGFNLSHAGEGRTTRPRPRRRVHHRPGLGRRPVRPLSRRASTRCGSSWWTRPTARCRRHHHPPDLHRCRRRHPDGCASPWSSPSALHRRRSGSDGEPSCRPGRPPPWPPRRPRP